MDELVQNLSTFFVLFRDETVRQQKFQALFDDKSFAASEEALLWQIFQAKFQFGLPDETIYQCYPFMSKRMINRFLREMTASQNRGLTHLSNSIKLCKLTKSEKSILRHLAKGGKLYNVPASNLSNSLSSVSYTIIEDNTYLNLGGVSYSEIRFLPIGNILYMHLGHFTTSSLSGTNAIFTINNPNKNFFKGFIDTEMGWEITGLQKYKLEQRPTMQDTLNKAIAKAENTQFLEFKEEASIPNRSYGITPIYDIYTPIEYEGGKDCIFSLKKLDYTMIVVNEFPQEQKLAFTVLLSSGRTRLIISKWLEADYRLCGFCDEEKHWQIEGFEQYDLAQVDKIRSKIATQFNLLRSSGVLYLDHMQGDQAQSPVETQEQMLGDQPIARLLSEEGYATYGAMQPPLIGTNASNLSSMMDIIKNGVEGNDTLLALDLIGRNITGKKHSSPIPNFSVERQQKEKIEELEVTVMPALRKGEKKWDSPEPETSSSFWGNGPLIGAIISAAGLSIASIGGLFYYFKRKKNQPTDVDAAKEMSGLLNFANTGKGKEEYDRSSIPPNERVPLFGDDEKEGCSSGSASSPFSMGNSFAENDWRVQIITKENTQKKVRESLV